MPQGRGLTVHQSCRGRHSASFRKVRPARQATAVDSTPSCIPALTSDQFNTSSSLDLSRSRRLASRSAFALNDAICCVGKGTTLARADVNGS